MKTSFAPFEQEVYCKDGNRQGSYRRTVYIDCEQVKAVSPAIDFNGKPVNGKSEVFITGEFSFTVIGEADKVMETVRSYCKGSKP